MQSDLVEVKWERKDITPVWGVLFGAIFNDKVERPPHVYMVALVSAAAAAASTLGMTRAGARALFEEFLDFQYGTEESNAE